MGMFEFNDVGIDLGTSSVLVYVKNKGIVLREPSVVAVEKITGQIYAVGEKARRMLCDNRAKLDELAGILYEKETITGDEFMSVLNGKVGE